MVFVLSNVPLVLNVHLDLGVYKAYVQMSVMKIQTAQVDMCVSLIHVWSNVREILIVLVGFYV